MCDTFARSPEQYSQFQYNQGVSYLEAVFRHDEELRSQLEASALFWAWWRHQWQQRDQRLAADIKGLCFDRIELDALYMGTHDVDNLTTLPHSIILEKSLNLKLQTR